MVGPRSPIGQTGVVDSVSYGCQCAGRVSDGGNRVTESPFAASSWDWMRKMLVPDFGSHELTGAQQQGVDVSSMCCHVQLQERIGAAVTGAFGLPQGEAELIVERAGLLQRQRFGQIPAQLMEVPHDREHLEHLLCGSRSPPPVLSAESDLRPPAPRRNSRKRCIPENPAAAVRCGCRSGSPGAGGDKPARPSW